MQDLYTENYKTLLKEIKGDLNKWKAIHGQRFGRIKLLTWHYFPKQSKD